ncbi:hypothetical protein GCM10025782_23750 [Pedococcus ginsenosidimutans]|uniref:Glycosyltransferase RgtA/B/C/D-like domain-containing protein n=1 Tax=Pedococcus ginsenosidimutans TaxID=490570 RepID=A0ABP8YEV5_9MICO
MGVRAAMAAARAVPLALSSCVALVMAFVANRGLDPVDESYLLRMVDNPQATRPAGDVYLFAFVVHPLYELVGRDVAALRLAGFAIVAVAAAVLCRESLALLAAGGVVLRRSHVVLAVAVAAAASLFVFSFDVAVPAYRSVALVGLMAVAVGVARALRGHAVVGGACLGSGGWVTFVGKPTSAAALVVVLLVVVAGARLVSRRLVAATVVSGLVAAVLTLAVAQLSPAAALDYLSRGADGSSRLGNHSGVAMMLGLTNLRLEGLVVLGPLFVLPLVVARAWGAQAGRRRHAAFELGYAAAMVAVTVAACLLAGRWLGGMGLGWQVFSVGLVVPVVVAVHLAHRARSRGLVGRAVPGEAAYLGLLLVLPWVSAVGSNVSFTVGMPLTAVFWVVALAVVTFPREGAAADRAGFRRAMTLAAALTLTMTVAEQTNGLPGGDLSATLRPAQVGGGTLLLRPDDATAAQLIHDAARRGGLGPDTPVVDLTGVGAGYAFLAGGRPIGRAHLYADLPDSLAAARVSLDSASCGERARAWVVTAPSMGTGITPALTRGRVSFADDYEVMARFTSRQARGTWEIQLLRPTSSVPQRMGC